jgi:hypothetical protein
VCEWCVRCAKARCVRGRQIRVSWTAGQCNTYFDFSPETSANTQSVRSLFIYEDHILTHDGGLSGLVSVVVVAVKVSFAVRRSNSSEELWAGRARTHRDWRDELALVTKLAPEADTTLATTQLSPTTQHIAFACGSAFWYPRPWKSASLVLVVLVRFCLASPPT